jgi:hypothetical protein
MEIDMKKWNSSKYKIYSMAVLLIIALVILTGIQKASAAEQKKLPYLIKINRYHNTVTVYELDEKGKYSIPIKAMTCSVGTGNQTILGTFKTSQKYRWKELMGKVYGQYATRIVGGILFHSVYYYQNENPASLATAEYNKLGNAASHGCIRLTVADAKWIYDNCELGTTVIIYDDKKSPGPLGKPETIKIDKSVRWDPTDPDKRNPYAGKLNAKQESKKEIKEETKKESKPTPISELPKIEGIQNMEIPWGEELDLREGVTATSCLGKDITPLVEIEGEVNPYLPGDYKIVYSVEDELERLKMKIITVTVQESLEDPVITGVYDRVESSTVVIDEDYALRGVTASCNNIPLDNKLIKISINKKSNTEYYISYQLKLGERSVEAHATIRIE